MAQVLLRVIVDSGNFIAMPMEDQQARNIVRLWHAGQLGAFLTDQQQFLWGVRVDAIQIMHVVDPNALTPQGQPGSALGLPPLITSGMPPR